MFKTSLFAATVPAALRMHNDARSNGQTAHPLLEFIRLDNAAALARLGVSGDGLTEAEAAARLNEYGPNVVAQEKKKTFLVEIATRFFGNPINILLTVLAGISWFNDDAVGASIMLAMVFMAVFLSYFQESRTGRAVEQLRRMVSNTATARRVPEPAEGDDATVAPAGQKAEVPIDRLVPGDVVHLSAGDMIPADLRLLSAKDLFINQSALT